MWFRYPKLFHGLVCCGRHCGLHLPLIPHLQRIHPKKGGCRCWYPILASFRQRGILHRGHHVRRGHRARHGHRRVHRGRHGHRGLHGHHHGRHGRRDLHLRGHRDRGGDVRPSSERLPS